MDLLVFTPIGCNSAPVLVFRLEKLYIYQLTTITRCYYKVLFSCFFLRSVFVFAGCWWWLWWCGVGVVGKRSLVMYMFCNSNILSGHFETVTMSSSSAASSWRERMVGNYMLMVAHPGDRRW